ncbi:MAG TPA: hypothetical protein PKA63_14665, partial [Oligoflexia bacterium]|nr:hypothetical protein [Oligoflexia bacterium]HMP49908.1 hypothetical protein [Oligoflexia bacterium]
EMMFEWKAYRVVEKDSGGLESRNQWEEIKAFVDEREGVQTEQIGSNRIDAVENSDSSEILIRDYVEEVRIKVKESLVQETDRAHSPSANILKVKAKLEENGVESISHDVKLTDGLTKTVIEILPGDNSELNRYAKRMERARGVRILYDPALLEAENAGALFDSGNKIIYLSNESSSSGSIDLQVYHEKIHAVLDGIRDQGGDSIFFGDLDLGNSGFSLQEFVTYAELLYVYSEKSENRKVNKNLIRISEHHNVLKLYSDKLQDVLTKTNGMLSSPDSIETRIQERTSGDGKTFYVLEGSVQTASGIIRLDLDSASKANELVTENDAKERFKEKINELYRLSHEIDNLITELGKSLEDGSSSRSVIKAASSFRKLLSSYYITQGSGASSKVSSENNITHLESGLDKRRTKPLEVLAATHESLLDQVLNQSNLEVKAREHQFEISRSEDPFSVTVSENLVRLLFKDSGAEYILEHSLNDSERRFLETYLRNNESLFGSKYSYQSEALLHAVQYAELHSAFYGESLTPQKAADIMIKYLKREKYPASIESGEGISEHDRIQGLVRLGEAAGAINKIVESRFYDENLSRTGIESLQKAAESLVRENEEKAGQSVLDRMLQGNNNPDIESVVNQTRNVSKNTNPVEIHLGSSEKPLYDKNGREVVYIFSTELSPRGSLRIFQKNPLPSYGNGEVKSLADFFSRLEQASRVDQDSNPRWRLPAFRQVSSESVYKAPRQELSKTHTESKVDIEPFRFTVNENIETKVNGLIDDNHAKYRAYLKSNRHFEILGKLRESGFKVSSVHELLLDKALMSDGKTSRNFSSKALSDLISQGVDIVLEHEGKIIPLRIMINLPEVGAKDSPLRTSSGQNISMVPFVALGSRDINQLNPVEFVNSVLQNGFYISDSLSLVIKGSMDIREEPSSSWREGVLNLIQGGSFYVPKWYGDSATSWNETMSQHFTQYLDQIKTSIGHSFKSASINKDKLLVDLFRQFNRTSDTETQDVRQFNEIPSVNLSKEETMAVDNRFRIERHRHSSLSGIKLEGDLAQKFRDAGFRVRDFDSEMKTVSSGNPWMSFFKKPLGEHVVGLEGAVDLYIESGNLRIPVQVKSSLEGAIEHARSESAKSGDRVPVIVMKREDIGKFNPEEVLASLIKNGVWMSPGIEAKNPGNAKIIREYMKPREEFNFDENISKETLYDRVSAYAEKQFRVPKWLSERVNQNFINRYCDASIRMMRSFLSGDSNDVAISH